MGSIPQVSIFVRLTVGARKSIASGCLSLPQRFLASSKMLSRISLEAHQQNVEAESGTYGTELKKNK